MKKVYIQPSMKAHTVSKVAILAGSTGQIQVDKDGPGGPAPAKGIGFSEDLSDE